MAQFQLPRPTLRRRKGRGLLVTLVAIAGAMAAIGATMGYVSADHIHDRTGAPMPPPYKNVVIDPYTCFGPGIGYAYGPAPAFTLLRPTFPDLSQRIRYIPASYIQYNGGRDRYGYTDGSNCDRYYGYQQVPENTRPPAPPPSPHEGPPPPPPVYPPHHPPAGYGVPPPPAAGPPRP